VHGISEAGPFFRPGMLNRGAGCRPGSGYEIGMADPRPLRRRVAIYLQGLVVVAHAARREQKDGDREQEQCTGSHGAHSSSPGRLDRGFRGGREQQTSGVRDYSGTAGRRSTEQFRPVTVPGVCEETFVRYKANGSADMTAPSLVRAHGVVRRRWASPLLSMVRESSVTVVSASRLRDRVEIDASHGAAVHQR
jgi:hypothetical protein